MFPTIGVPQNGWFIVENPIKMDDLRVPLFFGNTHIDDQQLFNCLGGLDRHQRVHLVCQTSSLHCSFALEREPVDAAELRHTLTSTEVRDANDAKVELIFRCRIKIVFFSVGKHFGA